MSKITVELTTAEMQTLTRTAVGMCTFTTDNIQLPGDRSGITAYSVAILHSVAMRSGPSLSHDLQILIRKVAIIYKPLWGIFVPVSRSMFTDDEGEWRYQLFDEHYDLLDRCFNDRSLNYIDDPLRGTVTQIAGIMVHAFSQGVVPARGLRALGKVLSVMEPSRGMSRRYNICMDNPKCRLFYPNTMKACPWCAASASMEPAVRLSGAEEVMRSTTPRRPGQRPRFSVEVDASSMRPDPGFTTNPFSLNFDDHINRNASLVEDEDDA